MKDKKIIFALLAAAFSLLTYFHAVVKDLEQSHFYDFGHYWMAASSLKQGENVWAWDKVPQQRNVKISKAYDPAFSEIDIPIHSPGFFVMLMPLAFFNFRQAVILWLLLGHILLFCSLYIMLKAYKARPCLLDISIVLFLVFSFWPIREELHSAQPDFFIIFLVTLGMVLLQNKRVFWAGFALSLAMQLREYLAVIVLFFLCRRQWRAIFGICAGYISLKSAGILIFGAGKEIAYWQHIAWMFLNQAHTSLLNHSSLALISRVFQNSHMGAAYIAVYAAGLIFLIGLALFSTIKKDTDQLLGLSLFLVLSFLVSPWVHEQHYVVLYPVLILAWFKLEEKNSFIFYAWFIAAYLLLGLKYSFYSFSQFHSGLKAVISGGKLAGAAALFFLITKLLNPPRRKT